MRRGARSLHYLGLKSTYDGCWGTKAPIIAIPFHLKSTFDSPERTYHDAMSCSTWVELPGIGYWFHEWGHTQIHPSWWPRHSRRLVIFLSCFSGDDQSPLCTLGLRKCSARPSTFAIILAPLHFSLNTEIEQLTTGRDDGSMTTTTTPL